MDAKTRLKLQSTDSPILESQQDRDNNEYKTINENGDNSDSIDSYLKDAELFVEIFKYLPAFDVHKRVKIVSKTWFQRAKDDYLWMHLCEPYWPKIVLNRTLIRKYKSWTSMFLRKPHVNFDGIYVYEKAYWKTAILTDKFTLERKAVKCAYYRYLRFFPNGRVLYALVNLEPRRMISQIYSGSSKVHDGMYKVRKGIVLVRAHLGYMKMSMKLKIYNRKGGFGRMRIESLEGTDPKNGEKTSFPVDNEPFLFQRVTVMK
mmetsp:Transcript_34007/g.47377  ORF Transcript_34007/g.47377 Transcript_34007/m.47377 type:complete len:260 (+) Transcript_34007:48-827(+)